MPFSRSLTPAWLACVLTIALHGAEPPEPSQDPADPASAELKQDVPDPPDQPAGAEQSETPTVSDERPQAEAETPAVPASTPATATEPQQLPPPPAPIIVTPDFSPLVQANANLADRLAAMERMMVALEQFVELDLRRFNGWTPVELWSKAPFPKAGTAIVRSASVG